MKKIKLNILDIIIIIMIFLLIIAAYIKFSNYNKGDGATTASQKITYEIEINNVRDYTTNAFVMGDKIYDSQTNVVIGELKEKKVEQAVAYEKLETGEIIKAPVPNRYNLVLLIETDGIENENGFYANKTVELKVGSEKTIETLYVKTTGRIAKIETNK